MLTTGRLGGIVAALEPTPVRKQIFAILLTMTGTPKRRSEVASEPPASHRNSTVRAGRARHVDAVRSTSLARRLSSPATSRAIARMRGVPTYLISGQA